MLSCPMCRKPLPGTPSRCYACRGDLSALRHLRALADHHFNDAVRAARTQRWDQAAELLAVALVLNPADEEARGLLRKVRLHQKRVRKGARNGTFRR
ncbi:hypothetical protein ACFYO0_15725 [Streptomyces sp. NPDC006365]|uniref:hypothetical protein n=1 Tax=Streptomyces sp. NPDC006365 TaxID=3364744 RepID=UPI00368E49BE